MKKLIENKSLIFWSLAIFSLALAIIKLGFATGLLIILIIWALLFFLLFIQKIVKVAMAFFIIAITGFVLSILVSFGVLFNFSVASVYEKTSEGIAITDCTSTLSDQPATLDDWRVTIYSGALLSSSPEVSQANNIRTFSYSGIKNKTETNSLYTRFEKTDYSYITGYSTGIEVCDANNKATASYTTANNDYAAGDDVSASINYFHGGQYLHGAGEYRVDAYVKTLDGKWHLVNRETGIEITE